MVLGLEKKILLCNRDLRWRKVDCYCKEEDLSVEGHKNNNYFVTCNWNKVYWNVPTLRWSAENDSRASFELTVKKMTFRIVSRIHNLGCVLTTLVSCTGAMMLKKWMFIVKGTGSRFSAWSLMKMLFLCRDMVYRLWKQYDHVIMLSKNQSAHSTGSDLINLGADSCKLINHGMKPSGQQ